MTSFPIEHPEPPSDLNERLPLLFSLTPGTLLSRLHRRNNGAIFFGKTGRNRFDAPDGSFGVLYAGFDEHCA